MLKYNSILHIGSESYKVIGGVEYEDLDDKSLHAEYNLEKIKTGEKYLLKPEKNEYILYFEVDKFVKDDGKKEKEKKYRTTVYFGEINAEIGEEKKCLQWLDKNNIYNLIISGKDKKYYFGSKVTLKTENKDLNQQKENDNFKETNEIQDIKEKTQEKIKNINGKISETLKKEEIQVLKKKIKNSLKKLLEEKDVRLTKKPINITEIYITILLILVFGILIMIIMNEYKKMF